MSETAEQQAAAFDAALAKHRRSTRSREAKVMFLLRAGIIESANGKPSRKGRFTPGSRYQLVKQLGGPGIGSGPATAKAK